MSVIIIIIENTFHWNYFSLKENKNSNWNIELNDAAIYRFYHLLLIIQFFQIYSGNISVKIFNFIFHLFSILLYFYIDYLSTALFVISLLIDFWWANFYSIFFHFVFFPFCLLYGWWPRSLLLYCNIFIWSNANDHFFGGSDVWKWINKFIFFLSQAKFLGPKSNYEHYSQVNEQRQRKCFHFNAGKK